MTEEHAKEICCVLAAISSITGESPNKVLSDICSQALSHEVTIDKDGYMRREVYTRYLEAKGWKGLWRGENFPAPIPPTCLVIYNGHVFALVNGVVYDNGSHSCWGREILAIYVPPEVN